MPAKATCVDVASTYIEYPNRDAPAPLKSTDETPPANNPQTHVEDSTDAAQEQIQQQPAEKKGGWLSGWTTGWRK